MQVMLSWPGLCGLLVLHCAASAIASLTSDPALLSIEDNADLADAQDLNIDMLLKRAPLRFGKRAPLRFGKRSFGPLGFDEAPVRRLRAAPMRFGKRYFWESEFFTKKSPMRFGKRAPLRFGKRSVEEEDDLEEDLMKRAAPMRFGKREDEVEDEIAGGDLDKRAAPMRFGKRAPLRFGKRAAPLRFGKRWPHYEIDDLHQAEIKQQILKLYKNT
jgi:FMRFamide related peptide family